MGESMFSFNVLKTFSIIFSLFTGTDVDGLIRCLFVVVVVVVVFPLKFHRRKESL